MEIIAMFSIMFALGIILNFVGARFCDHPIFKGDDPNPDINPDAGFDHNS